MIGEPDEFEQYRRKPLIDTEIPTDDFEQYRSQNQHKKSFGERLPAWLLGLGQFGEDFLKGQVEGAADPEVDIPEHWKPERVRKENLPERTTPSFNLEQYVDPDKMTQFNVGRYGPAIAGLAFGGYKGAKAAIKPLTNRAIGNKVVGHYKTNEKIADQKYGNVYENAGKQGVNKIPLDISKSDSKLFKDSFSSKQEKLLNEVLKNPTLENTHKFKSNLKSLVRKLGTKQLTKGLDGVERKALKTAEKTINKLDESIFKAMTEKGPSKLPSEYAAANEWYAKEQGPYLDNSAIRRAALRPTTKGAIDPRRLPRKLSLESGDPFLAAMGHKYPELSINRALTNPYYLSGLGIGSYGTKQLVKSILGE